MTVKMGGPIGVLKPAWVSNIKANNFTSIRLSSNNLICMDNSNTTVGTHLLAATCETSQVLLAGVSGGFSRRSPVFAPPTDWPVSYELK